MKIFLVLGSQRTGTFLLYSYLKIIKDLNFNRINFNISETYNPNKILEKQLFYKKHNIELNYGTSILKKLKYKINSYSKKNEKICGFLTKLNRNQKIYNYLYNLKNTYLIILYRKNIFKQFISVNCVINSGYFKITKYKKNKLNLNPLFFFEHVYKEINLYNFHINNFKNSKKLYLSYEELDLNFSISIMKILKFLNQNKKIIINNFEKQSIKQEFKNPSSRISNYSGLKNFFKNTIYSKYFIDELSSKNDIKLQFILFNKQVRQNFINRKKILLLINNIFLKYKIDNILILNYEIEIYINFIKICLGKDKYKYNIFVNEGFNRYNHIDSIKKNTQEEKLISEITKILILKKDKLLEIFKLSNKEFKYFNCA